jgi:uroporphyrin-III C-methyltransferase
MMPRVPSRAGIVYIVGAGPGDPELITVRGDRVLRRSDVVVYDRLVHPTLVRRARAVAERVFVGKTPGHGARQDAINALLIDRARRGLRVTRLKGGDPFVFGRGGEEAEALRAAGVRFEVVPGITSAVAVPAYAGIPVTHRRLGSAFAVVTGHECAGASDLDWAALARIPTVVVLMGHRSLEQIATQLMTHGAAPLTPAAVVSRGGTPDQHVVVATLHRIASAASAANLKPPSVFVVGQVVCLAGVLQWFAPAASDAERWPGSRYDPRVARAGTINLYASADVVVGPRR